MSKYRVTSIIYCLNGWGKYLCSGREETFYHTEVLIPFKTEEQQQKLQPLCIPPRKAQDR